MSALALTIPEGCRERESVREGRAPTGGRVKCATPIPCGEHRPWHGLTLLGCIWLCDWEQDTGPLSACSLNDKVGRMQFSLAELLQRSDGLDYLVSLLAQDRSLTKWPHSGLQPPSWNN